LDLGMPYIGQILSSGKKSRMIGLPFFQI